MAFDIEMIKKVYAQLPEKVKKAREVVARPLTLAEKILFAHLHEEQKLEPFARAKDDANFARTVLRCRTRPPRWPYCNLCKLGVQRSQCPPPFTVIT